MKKIWLLALASIISTSAAVEEFLTGDLELWDSIFASRAYNVLVNGHANDLLWTEGPVVIKNDDGDDEKLVFSENIAARTYVLALDKAFQNRSSDKTSSHLYVVKERSGDAPEQDDSWRAEPGANGLALLRERPPTLVMCQHGAQRLATMDLNTGEIEALASEYRGKRLNGPNDVVLRSENDGLWAYFTDPVYAWLEKDRFEDLPYLDTRVIIDGPGHCGVYRVKLKEDDSSPVTSSNIELITSGMMRPNGIGFHGDDLIISECCQGTHLDGCKSGTSRWMIFNKQEQDVAKDGSAATSWIHSETIEDMVTADHGVGGCADGFVVYEYVNSQAVKKSVLLASCFGGLCIIDLEAGDVVSRMWTARDDDGCKVSNIAIGKEYAFLTGSCGILTLPLVSQSFESGYKSSLHTEF